MKRFRHTAAAVGVVLVYATFSWAEGESKTGAFTETFKIHSSASTVPSIMKRFGDRGDPINEYDIEDIEFDIYLPESYDGKKRFGVLVWLSGGQPPDEWRQALKEHRLIWVAPDSVTYSTHDYHAYGMAVDAAVNAVKRYRVNKKKLFVGGTGYGGKIAVRVGIVFSDVFGGAMTVGSLDFFRRVDTLSDALMRYSASYTKPTGSLTGVARQSRRFVFFKPENTKKDSQFMSTVINGFGEMKFRHTTLIEVPSHGEMSGEKFASGLAFLLD